MTSENYRANVVKKPYTVQAQFPHSISTNESSCVSATFCVYAESALNAMQIALDSVVEELRGDTSVTENSPHKPLVLAMG